MGQTNSLSWRDWYDQLEKPSWTPEPATIGLIWQILYPVILITYTAVLIQVIRGKIPAKVLIPFAINLVANLVFTPIQFGLRNLPLATFDILIVWITIVWMIVAVRKYSLWIAVAQIPYLIWVSIAMWLQICITFWNV